jgi:glucose-6-phosphate isomerase
MTSTWETLTHLATQPLDLRDCFKADKNRQDRYTYALGDLSINFSRNHLTDDILSSLFALSEEKQVGYWVERLFQGDKVNLTEGRAACHTALRDPDFTPTLVDGQDITPEIRQSLDTMRHWSDQFQAKTYLGYTGQPITDIVHIGIGGSALGPELVYNALRDYQTTAKVHFVKSLDPSNLTLTLANLHPETTLFIVASKSFTSEETLKNANAAKRWFLAHSHDEKTLAPHFIALTANTKRAIAFGITPDHILALWDWVGGRFSLWSAVGLPVALAYGMPVFQQLLNGAHTLDQHFKTAPIQSNLPILLALTGIWYRNFYHTQSHAIIPYAQSLRDLPAHLQQVEMESNGKSVNREGRLVDYETAPVIWGAVGSESQHAFHQYLHQSLDITPVDFILIKETAHPIEDFQACLLRHAKAQADALLQGLQTDEPHKNLPGNKPSTTITLEKLTPFNLGKLLALYEHKVFVQSVIWDINAFDQFGVELGKVLANR